MAPRSASRDRIPAALFGGVFALLLLLIATGGPDCLRFLDWSRAAQSGNIAELPGEVRTPAGVPLTQWSHGPGLFFALPYLSPSRHLVSDGAFAPVRDFRFMGWLAALALWCGLLGILRRVTHHGAGVAPFIAAAAFAGTHLGFYSYFHSSEILSYGCLALIAYRLFAGGPLRALDVFGIGVLSGCLVLIRPNLLLYLPLVLGVLARRLWSEDRTSGTGQRAIHVASFAPPVLAALFQVLWVNRWMTGSLWRSAYAFGDGAFRSLDFTRPELLAVLVHPWHGLLVYHPLYALAFVLVVVGIFRGSRPSRWLHGGIAATLLAHLYLQAAWYCWWMGLWSLGNRGLGVGAVLLIPVLARALSDARPRARSALAAGAATCALWSLALMVQGHTNFVNWSELLAAQATAIRGFIPALPVALVASWLAYRFTRRRDGGGRLLAAGTGLIAALILDHLALRLVDAIAGTREGGWALAVRLCVVALAPVAALLDPPRTGLGAGPLRPVLRAALVAAPLALLIATGALFLRLAVHTERIIEAGGVPGRGPVATFHPSEVEESYREYLQVSGFRDKKRMLRDFLEHSAPR
jgi:hypothetical protein